MDFQLRPWQIDDLDNLVHHANNYEIAKNLTDLFPYPYSAENGRQFIELATHSQPNRILAIAVDGKAAGAIGIHPQDDIERMNAELGYWLGQEYWGRGIMTQAIQQMVAYGFQHWPVNRIYARPFGTNIGSQRALEKAGFILEARLEKTLFKFGNYVDELIYAVRRDKMIVAPKK